MCNDFRKYIFNLDILQSLDFTICHPLQAWPMCCRPSYCMVTLEEGFVQFWKTWNVLDFNVGFPGLGSPGKKPLVLESSGYEVQGRRIKIDIL